MTGRADVILDKEGEETESLAIVDYKTSTDPPDMAVHELQLAVYTDAGRRENLYVRAIYVHDLKSSGRQRVGVSPEALSVSRQVVQDTVRSLRDRDFSARPGCPCVRRDLRNLCRWYPSSVTSKAPGSAS